MDLRCSVVGLGKLGSCLAACLANAGYNVDCFDISPQVMECLIAGLAPVQEPGLQELLTNNRAKLFPAASEESVIASSQVSFLVLPTPSTPDGDFSPKFIEESLKSLGKALKLKKGYHLFVIVSTLSPTTIDKKLMPLLEEVTGKKCGAGFGICYGPQFIALGDVINGITKPDLLLVGENNPRDGDLLAEIYSKLCHSKVRISRMSIVSAEITKIALNAYVTMKISFANFLGNISQKVPGAEIDKITSTLGQDRRIGNAYLKAGLPFAGPCFPRDNRAFSKFAENLGLDAKLARATDEINQNQVQNIIKRVEDNLPLNAKIGVLGLAFKPKAPVLDESPMIKLVNHFSASPGVDIYVYDKLALKEAKGICPATVNFSSSTEECLGKTNIWVIGLPEPEFKIEVETRAAVQEAVIIDCWRIIDKSKITCHSKYVALGENI